VCALRVCLCDECVCERETFNKKGGRKKKRQRLGNTERVSVCVRGVCVCVHACMCESMCERVSESVGE